MASLGLEVKALSFIITNAYCHLDNILYILLNNIIFSPTVATLDVKHFSHYQMIGLFPCFKQTFRHQPQDYIFFLLISNFSFYQQWQNIFRWCSELQQAKSKLTNGTRSTIFKSSNVTFVANILVPVTASDWTRLEISETHQNDI